MLKKKTWDLEERLVYNETKRGFNACRMLTHEIRKSLDKHKILYTTLVELSKTLGLQNCAVWMPNVDKTEMNLTHELNGRNINFSIPITDPDVWISGEAGPVAAIRMPMLRVCNFKGGTPELTQACCCGSVSCCNLKVSTYEGEVGGAKSSSAAGKDECYDGKPGQGFISEGPAMLSNLINDAMDNSDRDDGRFPLEMKPFGLHGMIKEAACDEKRVFQVILHMVGSVINGDHGGGILVLRVFAETGSQGRNDQGWATWRPSSSSGDHTSDRVEERLSFSICKRIIQLMQGNIWLIPNAQGFPQAMALVLRFQLRRSIALTIPEPGESSEPSNSNSFFRGLQVLLADNDDDLNASVLLDLLDLPFKLFLDLHMPELDGFEVATRIRKFRSRNWPLIVALTASTEDICGKNACKLALMELSESQFLCKELLVNSEES
ncbi:Signal transduction response regulator, receiver domain [Sesbania bispinosa]|nr:Signal transduction response regulator, receiver domain [Sesbania bispinosa]